MKEDVEKRLASLASVAADLNAASDAVSAWLRTLENRLANLNLGVEVMLDTRLNENVSGYLLCDLGEGCDLRYVYEGSTYYLGYSRVAGRWRLVVQEVRHRWHSNDEDLLDEGLSTNRDYEDDREVIGCTPLMDTSRELRISATHYINSLLALIEKAARERVDALHRAMATADTAIGGVNKPAADGTVQTRPSERAADARLLREGKLATRRKRATKPNTGTARGE